MPIIGNFGGGGGNVTSDGKTHLSLEDVFGPGPYEIEFVDDGEGDYIVTTHKYVLDDNGVLKIVNEVTFVDADMVRTTLATQDQVSAISGVANAAKTRADEAYALAESKATENTYTVQVPVAWTADATNGGFTQTIAVQGIQESDNPIWDLVLGDTPATNDAHQEAYGLIDRLTTANGFVKLWANGDAPTVAITIQLKVVRS